MLISVIIPIYNVQDYLKRCLESLKNQKTFQIEFICVDDGSTDKSGIICDEFAKKDNRFKVIHKENGGVSSARNVGLENAIGKYIAWVDPDDYITLNWYECIEEYLKKNIDILFFDYALKNDKKIISKNFGEETSYLDKENFLNNLVLDNIKSHLWQMVFKRDIIKNIEFPLNISFMEDFSVLHKIVLMANKIVYLHEILYFYRIRKNSLTNRWTIEQNYKAYCIAKERYDYLMRNGYSISKIGYLMWALNVCCVYYRNKNKKYIKYFISCKKEIDNNKEYILKNRECNKVLKFKFWLFDKNLLNLVLVIKNIIRKDI